MVQSVTTAKATGSTIVDVDNGVVFGVVWRIFEVLMAYASRLPHATEQTSGSFPRWKLEMGHHWLISLLLKELYQV